MATKVFLRFNRDIRDVYVKGREYEVLQRTDGLIRAKSELGIEFFDFETNKKYFDVIEREDSTTFEAHGHTWFKHVPGDAMPCDGEAAVIVLRRDGVGLVERPAHYFRWELPFGSCSNEHDAIGWRFADSAPAKPAPSDWISIPAGNAVMVPEGVPYVVFPSQDSSSPNTKDWTEYPHSTAGMTLQPKGAGEFKGYDDLPGPPPQQSAPFDSFAWLEFLKLAAPDVAAVEDTSLPPRHRKIVNAKEDAQAEREKAAAEALAKSEQEKSDQLKRDGEALSRDFDNQHGHRMGWMRAMEVVKC